MNWNRSSSATPPNSTSAPRSPRSALPSEYAWSLSTGIVSGLDRTIEAPNGFTVAHRIQTDAAVNPGNSGGPLLDSAGEVVGVVDQIATDGSADQSSGVGFAVPSNQVAAELDALAAGEEVEHAYLGVASGNSTSATSGAEVGEVVAGSPAAEAGIESGDVITSLDEAAIADQETSSRRSPNPNRAKR